ncbi:hypothetical protein FY534_14240 (plasmid) [Alicyclobacillus sp. TC]|uniref:Lipoprotein n=1 Tax=Alicyclobacillus tolerans TaxID=90970 RepID=A0ABT9M082_9BACL|nr:MULTISPECIES: hypothetical protein [Alicyclobacillus]MDP9729927.1 hypothetical protein [Alicyclobacillus tengchongensis]QRF24929.1 hypothetical protein FY534_14240 [Alicyclobacillus sp. TC]
MQKRIWGLTASMLALTCLTVTGCGTSIFSMSNQEQLNSKNSIHQTPKKFSTHISNKITQNPVLLSSKENIIFHNSSTIPSDWNMIRKFNGSVKVIGVLGTKHHHLFPLSFFYPYSTIQLNNGSPPSKSEIYWKTNRIELTNEFFGNLKGEKFIILAGNLVQYNKIIAQQLDIVGGVFIEYLNNKMFLHFTTINNPAVDFFTHNDVILGYQAGANYQEINLMNGNNIDGNLDGYQISNVGVDPN